LIKVIGEITVDTFREFMEQIECGRSDQTVLISSPGGDVGYTLAMLDNIDEHKRPTRATGICQSAAAVLATTGEGIRTCTMDALFRFIPPEQEETPVTDLRHYLHSLLVSRVAQRLKIALAESNDLFDGEFISSARAKELGLIDEVISTEEPNGNLARVSGCERGADYAEYESFG